MGHLTLCESSARGARDRSDRTLKFDRHLLIVPPRAGNLSVVDSAAFRYTLADDTTFTDHESYFAPAEQRSSLQKRFRVRPRRSFVPFRRDCNNVNVQSAHVIRARARTNTQLYVS